MLHNATVFAVTLSLSAFFNYALADTQTSGADPGPLDRPLPIDSESDPSVTNTLTPSRITVAPVQSQEELREEVVEEQESLEKLPRADLEVKAEQGERAAQVVLGADYAREATQLSFSPAAANDALSDAVRWYSLAASRGFPGAPSLDQSGIRFFPIRVQREQQP